MTELLNVILPSGKGVVLVYSLYSDESVDSEGNVLTVAGYLIGSKQLPKLTNAWSDALNGELPYLHMCDGHATSHPAVFARISALFTYDHFMQGFSVSIRLKESTPLFQRQLSQTGRDTTQSVRYWFGSPETFCATQLAYLANSWIDQNNPSEADIAYVHERGGSSCGEMAEYAKRLRQIRARQEGPFASMYRKLRFYSYNAVDGKRSDGGALQAADFLAWTCNHAEREGSFPEVCIGAYSSIEVRSLLLTAADIEKTIEATADKLHVIGMRNRSKRIG